MITSYKEDIKHEFIYTFQEITHYKTLKYLVHFRI